nr:MAG TPA: hypothetical protein [Caudoviricetes sp.]
MLIIFYFCNYYFCCFYDYSFVIIYILYRIFSFKYSAQNINSIVWFYF